jgi:hypothetical protein
MTQQNVKSIIAQLNTGDLINNADRHGKFEFTTGVWIVKGDYLAEHHADFNDEGDEPLVYLTSPHWLITMNHGPHPINEESHLTMFLKNPHMIDPCIFSE